MTCLTTVYSDRPTLRCRWLFTPVLTTFSRYRRPLLWTTNDMLRMTFTRSGRLFTMVTVTNVTYRLGCNVNGQYIEEQSEPLVRAWNAWFCVPCYFQRGRVGLSLPPTCVTGHTRRAHLPKSGETASSPGMSAMTVPVCHPTHMCPWGLL